MTGGAEGHFACRFLRALVFAMIAMMAWCLPFMLLRVWNNAASVHHFARIAEMVPEGTWLIRNK